MRYRTVLLFGAPGAGKGTQGKILGSIPGYFHCACGDVFRNLTVDNELGRKFVEFSAKGQLVPDEYTVKLWRQNIDASTVAGRFNPDRDVLVLDGIPRTVPQAELLKETLDVRAIIYLSCPDTQRMVERLQRRALRENRLDDANIEVIMQRLQVYRQETKPVLDYYGEHLVHTVDATQHPVEVLQDVLNVVSRSRAK
jgi:adenylate kinase